MILESRIDKWREARGYTPALGNEQLSEVQLLPLLVYIGGEPN